MPVITEAPQAGTRPGVDGPDDVCHIVSWWQHVSGIVLRRVPWSLCGILLTCRCPSGVCRCPGPSAPVCPLCALAAGWT